MRIPTVFNIQKFSLHDGPGIRTTVFFKGCPLRCLWCHNPESQCYQPEIMLDKNGNSGSIGTQYTIPELVKRLQADHIFYDQSGGGVTLSGGEVMTQDMDYVQELVRELQRLGISVVVDTCGFAPQDHFSSLLPYVDLFLYDIKCMDSGLHQELVGQPNDLILDNLKFLSDQKARIDLRLILVDGVNTDEQSVGAITQWLYRQGVVVETVTLLPYHDFGRDKYNRLQRECTQQFAVPPDKTIHHIQQLLQQAGYSTRVGA